ncbi:MAG: nitroreductase family deazaflavin-dependent oxidoreductase [Actinobacteria bacterium]|nr:nitroreductase family deazaflavin-dependent oxidoreductase [Actinomycetota bacterium]
MALTGTYEPSPWEPIAKQVEEYESSDGEHGRYLEGRPCIILTTVGAKSGNLRKTPLMRVAAGDHYAVIGSMGGAPEDPQWVHNLRANPRAELQDGPRKHEYTVREVEGDERSTWWEIACREWPPYDDYQAKTERQIPVFVLEPAD